MKHILAILTLTLVGACLYFLSSAFLNRESSDALIELAKDHIADASQKAKEVVDSHTAEIQSDPAADESSEGDATREEAAHTDALPAVSQNETAAIYQRIVRRIEASQTH